MAISNGLTLKTHEGRVGNTRFFDSFELSFPLQNVTVILGESGVGKSTLLKALLGNLSDTCLEVTSPFSHVAWMAQQDLLLPWMTVLDNVVLGDALRGKVTTLAREKALSLLELMGLEPWASAFPFTLSGGMRQRVALARTLMEDAPLILMDEPFSALDTVNRYYLQQLAAQMFQEKTVVLVTHDPKEALRLGHQIVVLGGFPARIHDVLTWDAPIPRAVDDPTFQALESRLLASLLAASEVA